MISDSCCCGPGLGGGCGIDGSGSDGGSAHENGPGSEGRYGLFEGPGSNEGSGYGLFDDPGSDAGAGGSGCPPVGPGLGGGLFKSMSKLPCRGGDGNGPGDCECDVTSDEYDVRSNDSESVVWALLCVRELAESGLSVE